ncbi:hypothetical protein [Oerskovia paurometabola]|uniref:DUF3558 domain-containing protein n=1 Tax=Oerskovia paurometabola TaxID=162170 RepID=A0ABW1XDL5_9CELL|nr:hypothetical protein [Oerskovia paurometabola]MBM7498901.1 hypothetical protein [Oerskovia paurometabola]
MNSLRRHVLTVVLPGVLGATLLTGCASPTDAGGDGPATGAPAPAAASETPSAAGACDLIGGDQVTALAGQSLDGPFETTVAGNVEFPACVWGDPAGATVQVSRIPAADWAQQLPEMLQQLEATGLVDDAENTRKIREASALVGTGEKLDAVQACEIFSTTIEIAGGEPGRTETVNIVPSLEDPQALTGQSCRDGVFSSVLVMKDGITGAPEEVATVEQALAAVAAH